MNHSGGSGFTIGDPNSAGVHAGRPCRPVAPAADGATSAPATSAGTAVPSSFNTSRRDRSSSRPPLHPAGGTRVQVGQFVSEIVVPHRASLRFLVYVFSG